MTLKSSNTPPSTSFVQIVPVLALNDRQIEPEMDLWEPPFERWMRLADDLLRGDLIESCQEGRVLPPS